MTTGQRHIVEVRDIRVGASLCPAEAILHEVPAGRVRGDLYPAAMLDEGGYVLWLNDQNWTVFLQRSESEPPPAMVIESDTDPPADHS
jgi:hypothetical protein